jgi:hypothetical protein
LRRSATKSRSEPAIPATRRTSRKGSCEDQPLAGIAWMVHSTPGSCAAAEALLPTNALLSPARKSLSESAKEKPGKRLSRARLASIASKSIVRLVKPQSFAPVKTG